MDIVSALFTIYHLFQQSGGFIFPLLLASVLTGGLLLEQFWYSLLSRRRLKLLMLEPVSWKRIQGMDMVSRMLRSLQQNLQATESQQKRDMEMIYSHFERRIHWLNTMAALAPMLGLLGTVAGMIRIFAVVSAEKVKDPLSQLSAGISEALFATGAGLIVAILAAIGFHFLNAHLESTGQEMARWYEDHRHQLHVK